ncbi:2-oxo acid dehydrogenase subunit E2 [Pseudonocardia kujensis]|uniref:2-oxo acid dehydrogenase subunit E2 n=1 Tax=Pseudonocardia kujensis TaxID=1128675 RepID=UPI0027DF8FA0|nr:2-oxo acid dehydrogenase subunit E2 [Pseudonocardia kujensis]
MPQPVTMPELGESVTEGTVTRWLKNVGDSLEIDEALLEVSTDKVDTEIPSPFAGTLVEILVAEDETVEVGGLLARVEETAQGTPPAPEPTANQAAENDRAVARLQDPDPSPSVLSEPAAASAASVVKEPGPAPAATAAELAPPPAPASTKSATVPVPGTTVPMPRLRQIIARRMTESLTVSAQLTTVQEVDVTRIARLRTAAKADFQRREGVPLTYLPFFAKAAVEALSAFPALNASISDDGKSVAYHAAVHLSIAVDTPRGLLVPVIRDAQDLGLAGLARRIADVAERARANTITADELTGGTFTITNIGSVGAEFDTPILNQPQVAILATGAIRRRPAVVSGPDGDMIAIRSMCYLPMTYDHRLIDGADAGRFVSAVRARLEAGDFGGELGQEV